MDPLSYRCLALDSRWLAFVFRRPDRGFSMPNVESARATSRALALGMVLLMLAAIALYKPMPAEAELRSWEQLVADELVCPNDTLLVELIIEYDVGKDISNTPRQALQTLYDFYYTKLVALNLSVNPVGESQTLVQYALRDVAGQTSFVAAVGKIPGGEQWQLMRVSACNGAAARASDDLAAQ